VPLFFPFPDILSRHTGLASLDDNFLSIFLFRDQFSSPVVCDERVLEEEDGIRNRRPKKERQNFFVPVACTVYFIISSDQQLLINRGSLRKVCQNVTRTRHLVVIQNDV
jgi:hypothetical protein